MAARNSRLRFDHALESPFRFDRNTSRFENAEMTIVSDQVKESHSLNSPSPERAAVTFVIQEEATGTEHNYVVDVSLFTNRAPVLEQAIQNSLGTVTVHDEDPIVFSNWLQCLKFGPERVSDLHNGAYAPAYKALIDVWILAVGIEDHRTANHVVDEIQRRHTANEDLPHAAAINVAFAKTTSRYALIRKLMVDLFVLDASEREFERARIQGASGEFWCEVAKEQKAMGAQLGAMGPGMGVLEEEMRKRVRDRPRCDYHYFRVSGGCESCGVGEGEGQGGREGDWGYIVPVVKREENWI